MAPIVTSVHTDDHGLYLLTGLRPSTYTIKVEAAGFRSAESKDVVLGVDQQASLNFSLKPVGFNITVDVTTAPPLLETDSAALERMSAMNTCATFRCTTAAFSVWCFWLGE